MVLGDLRADVIKVERLPGRRLADDGPVPTEWAADFQPAAPPSAKRCDPEVNINLLRNDSSGRKRKVRLFPSAWCPQRDYTQTRAGATCDFTDGRLVIEGVFPATREADRQISPTAGTFNEAAAPAPASASAIEIGCSSPEGTSDLELWLISG
jgi:hypothetical protein